MATTPSKKTTSTKAKSTRKPAATKPTTPIKRVPSPLEVAPSMSSTEKAATVGAPKTASAALKKRELIEKVVLKSGIKKKDAKPVVEAMLEVLGDALADGRELNLRPLGKLKLNRTKETASARIIVAKIRQSKDAQKPNAPVNPTVAAAAE